VVESEDSEMAEKKDDPEKGGGVDVEAALQRVKRFFATASEHTVHAWETYGPSLERFEFISKPIEELKARAQGTVYSASEAVNGGLPAPLPSLMRNQSWQIVQTASVAGGLICGLSVRKIKGTGFIKHFAIAGLFTGVAVGSVCELVKYKWNHPLPK